MPSIFQQSKKILGMNARNLSYIGKYNSRADKKFTTDKLYSKNFLESRGINVAKTYHAIDNHRQLTPEFFESLPSSFVIKPNKGWGGGGIIVITEKKGKKWITASGKRVDEEQLYQHCSAILDGKYSMSGINDKIIIEEILEKHSALRNFTDIGLPDIRLIVFNTVPIMAMMRVPTHESEGKANMELGAIGVGIDIGTGVTTRGAKFSKRVLKMPNGFPIKEFKIPEWEEILLTGSRIQNFTGIGYLGIDFVLTKSGVKVLELNALSGLKIQVANKIALKQRLEKVQDLKVKTPEEGVEIAKTLFTQKSTPSQKEEKTEKAIIGRTENIILNADKPKTLKAQIDTLAEKNIIKATHYNGSMLDITILGKRLKLPVEKGRVQNADIILAGKFLNDFYIDPSKESASPMGDVLTAHLDEKMILSVDEKIYEIDEKIKLLSYINPQNLEEQKELFLENPEFSPRFFYKKPEIDLEHLKREVKKTPIVNHELYPLFERKITQIENKIDLILSVGSDKFQFYSEELFGSIEKNSYQSAIKFLNKYTKKNIDDTSETLDTKTAQTIIEDFLKSHKLSHWKISIIPETVSDIQVTKRHTILLKKNATFKRNRLQALLAHEIGTHVFRFENGKRQPFRIFERGTAGYLRTEEGLAIWNQNALGLELGEKFLTPAYQVVSIYLGQKMSFLDLFHYLKTTYDISNELAWKLCLKAKRGLTDTSKTQVFTKDSIYFRGYQDIKRFIKEKGEIKDLYVGKIAIKDLPLIQKIENIVEPKFLL